MNMLLKTLPVMVIALAMALILSCSDDSSDGSDPSSSSVGGRISSSSSNLSSSSNFSSSSTGISDYCVYEDGQICVPFTNVECSSLNESFGSGLFFATCPANYDNSPKGCYYSYDYYDSCDLITSNSNDCLSHDGEVMDYADCMRRAGTFTFGACTTYEGECKTNISLFECQVYYGEFNPGETTCQAIKTGSCVASWGECFDDVLPFYCHSYYYGKFTEEETCPAPQLGSCILNQGSCEDGVTQFYCDNYSGEFNPGETCPAQIQYYCAYTDVEEEEDVCDIIGGESTEDEDDCSGKGGILATLEACEEEGRKINGMD